jgi:hypothetical protein
LFWQSDLVDDPIRQGWPGESSLVVVHRHFEAEDDLPLIAQALDAARLFLRLGQRGQEQASEDRDNGDNDEQFDEGEASDDGAWCGATAATLDAANWPADFAE